MNANLKIKSGFNAAENPSINASHDSNGIFSVEDVLSRPAALPSAYVSGRHVYKTKTNRNSQAKNIQEQHYVAQSLNKSLLSRYEQVHKNTKRAKYVYNQVQKMRKPLLLNDYFPEHLQTKPDISAKKYGFDVNAPVFVPKNKLKAQDAFAVSPNEEITRPTANENITFERRVVESTLFGNSYFSRTLSNPPRVYLAQSSDSPAPTIPENSSDDDDLPVLISEQDQRNLDNENDEIVVYDPDIPLPSHAPYSRRIREFEQDRWSSDEDLSAEFRSHLYLSDDEIVETPDSRDLATSDTQPSGKVEAVDFQNLGPINPTGQSLWIAFVTLRGYKRVTHVPLIGEYSGRGWAAFGYHDPSNLNKPSDIICFSDVFDILHPPPECVPSPLNATMESDYILSPRSNKYRAQMQAANKIVKLVTDPLGTRDLADSVVAATSKTDDIAKEIMDSFHTTISQNTSAITEAFQNSTSELSTLINSLKDTLIGAVSTTAFSLFEKMCGLMLALWACDRVPEFETRAIIISCWATSAGVLSTAASALTTSVNFWYASHHAQSSAFEMFAAVTEVMTSVMGVKEPGVGKLLKSCNKLHQLSQGIKGTVDLVKLVSTAYRYVCRRFFGITTEAQEIYDSATEWCDKVRDMLRLDVNNMLFESPQFRTDFENLYKQGDEIFSELCTIKGEDANLTAKNVSDVRVSLKHFKSSLDKVKASMTSRQEPVGIQFFGEAGVGKSYAVKYLMADIWADLYALTDPGLTPEDGVYNPFKDTQFLKQINMLTDKDVYDWNALSEYFPTYNNQKFFVADDVFQMDDQVYRSRIGMEIIRFINTTPYSLNMAELSEKGVTKFRSEWFFLLMNKKHFPPNMKVEDVGAVERRLHFRVEVQVKPEFGYKRRNQDGHEYYAIDLEKAMSAKDELDPYIFILHIEDRDHPGRHYKQEHSYDALKTLFLARHALHSRAGANPMLQRFSKKVAAMKDRHQQEMLKASTPPVPGSPAYKAQALTEHEALVVETTAKVESCKSRLASWLATAKKVLDTDLAKTMLKLLSVVGGLSALYFIGKWSRPQLPEPGMQVSGDPRTIKAGKPQLVIKKPLQHNPHVGYVAQVQDPNAMAIMTTSIARNLFKLSWCTPKGDDIWAEGPSVHALFTHERFCSTVKHWFALKGDHNHVRFRNKFFDIAVPIDMVKTSDVEGYNDWVVLQIANAAFPPARDIRSLICTQDDLLGDIRDVVTLSYYNKHGTNSLDFFVREGKAQRFMRHLDYFEGAARYELHDYISIGISNNFGDCGRVYLVMNTRMERKILAMHVAGDDTNVESVAVPFFPILKHKFYVGQAGYNLQCPPNLEDCGILPPAETPRLPSETKIRPSRFARYLKRHGYVSVTKPARLGPDLDKDGNLQSPAQIGLNKYPARTPCNLDEEQRKVLVDCCHAVARFIPFNVRPISSVVEDKIALNGHPGWHHSDKINMKSSPGYNFVLLRTDDGKWSFIRCAECKNNTCRDIRHELEFTSYMEKRLHDLETKVISAQTYEDVEDLLMIMNCLKDERVKLSKWEEFNTRIFNIMPLDFFILRRKYFMVLCENMMSDPVNSFSALGINPHSSQWGMLYNKKIKRRNLPGDYKFYDGSHQTWFSDLITDEVVLEYFRIHFEHEVNFDLLQDIRAKLEHMAYHSKYIMLWLVYRIRGANPSGDYLTTVRNILLNIVANCFAYVLEARRLNIRGRSGGAYTPEDYFQDVDITAFGDDHNEATDDEWYTMQAKKENLALLSLKYTNPDKTEITPDTPKFYPPEGVTYLKRSFRWQNGYCYAPLPEQVIYEIVFWTVDENVDLDSRDRAAATSSVLEMVHHGEEKYNHWRKFVLTMFAHFKIGITLPTFKEADAKLRTEGFYCDEKSLAKSMSAPSNVLAQSGRTTTNYVTRAQRTRDEKKKKKEQIVVSGTKYNVEVPQQPQVITLSNNNGVQTGLLINMPPPPIDSSLDDRLKTILSLPEDSDLIAQWDRLIYYVSPSGAIGGAGAAILSAFLSPTPVENIRELTTKRMWLGHFCKTNQQPTTNTWWNPLTWKVPEAPPNQPAVSVFREGLLLSRAIFSEIVQFIYVVTVAPVHEELLRSHTHLVGLYELVLRLTAGRGSKEAVAHSMPAFIMHTLLDILSAIFGLSSTFSFRVAVHAFFNMSISIMNSPTLRRFFPRSLEFYIWMLNLYKKAGYLTDLDISAMIEYNATYTDATFEWLFPTYGAKETIVLRGGFLCDRLLAVKNHFKSSMDALSRGDNTAFESSRRAFEALVDTDWYSNPAILYVDSVRQDTVNLVKDKAFMDWFTNYNFEVFPCDADIMKMYQFQQRYPSFLHVRTVKSTFFIRLTQIKLGRLLTPMSQYLHTYFEQLFKDNCYFRDGSDDKWVTDDLAQLYDHAKFANVPEVAEEILADPTRQARVRFLLKDKSTPPADE